MLYLGSSKLSRARAADGSNTAAALDYFEEFLALWKDVDPDLQPLRDAKAEYAHLRVLHPSE
jgi:hypothetical protein